MTDGSHARWPPNQCRSGAARAGGCSFLSVEGDERWALAEEKVPTELCVVVAEVLVRKPAGWSREASLSRGSLSRGGGASP